MSAFLASRRLRIAGVVAVAVVAMVSAFGGSAASNAKADDNEPMCVQRPQLCTEKLNPWTYEGETYISGHDEPSVLFYSNRAGSGNQNEYRVNLPTDPAAPPLQNGTGTTWNFQLRPTYWFGMAMCDDQSAPDPGKPCPPDSDSNIHSSLDPTSPDYIGRTPGTAFMELQFYPPGWGPISCTDANGNQDGKWCAALTIDSDQENSNTGVQNNDACNDLVGPEPVNYAVLTKSGKPVAPANPGTPFGEQAVVTPDTVEFNNGDHLILDMHDTSAGFQVSVKDLTSGGGGSMTASTANGFGHALFQPNASKCHIKPYAFHPMYSTSTPETRVLWAAHTYNVAGSDEIGHFEYCDAISNFACTGSGTDPSPDFDDFPCFLYPVVSPKGKTISSLGGCLGEDEDFDGPSYQNGHWPGSPGAVAGNVPTPFMFTSPIFHTPGVGPMVNYQRVAFETDLPRIEGADTSPNNDCQRHVYNPMDPSPGSGCVNPPNGATFYPIYSTTNGPQLLCYWQVGGGSIPGTTNNFGGTSAAEYGGLLESIYPAPGFVTQGIYETFHRDLSSNPCLSHQQ